MAEPPRISDGLAHPRRLVVVALFLVMACFAAYWSWLGWDHTYQVDPKSGMKSGPYEPWQVAGCVLSLIAVALAAGLARQAFVAMVVMPLAFTVAWSIPAASSDETGLWGVGTIMILVGLAFGVTVVALPAAGLHAHRHGRTRD